jgi:hypothetical protein
VFLVTCFRTLFPRGRYSSLAYSDFRFVSGPLFVPVVMEILHHVATGQEQFASCRWFEPFRKRSELLDVDLRAPDKLLSDAQILLDQPFKGLGQLVESTEDADD